MIHPEQMEFPSIGFPADRRVLMVQEVAERLRISEQHVIDLIEEGKIQGINIGGHGRHYYRIPKEGFEAYVRENHTFVV